jgi:hypothetical protein
MRPFTITQYLEQVLRDYSDGVNTSIPARIERVETRGANLWRVDVQPLIKADYTNEEGSQVVETLPVVTCVPVVMPGAGGYRMTFPVLVGDTVLLVFSQASLDKWLHVGGLVDPGDFGRFDLSDAIAIPGLRDFAHPWASSPMDRMTIGADVGPQIEINPAIIKLGQLAVEGTLKDASFLTALATLVTAIAAAFTASEAPAGAAATAEVEGALTTFLGAAATYTTTVTKVS